MKIRCIFIVYFFALHASFSQTLFNRAYTVGAPPNFYPPGRYLKSIQAADKSYFLYGGEMYPVAGFLGRMDSSGVLLWIKKAEYPNSFGGTEPIFSDAIQDHNHDMLFATQNDYPDAGSLFKSDSAGNPVWDIHFDFPVSNVVLTSDSNYAVIGRKAVSVFGQNAQIQFYKISSSGTVIFGKEYWAPGAAFNYNSGEKETYGLIQFPDGNFFVLANVIGYILITKINASGQAIWNKEYLTSVFADYHVHRPARWRMELMPDTTLLICGRANDFFSNELVCFKINSDGNVLWSEKFSTPDYIIREVNEFLNPDTTVSLFVQMSDTPQYNFDHVILKIDQNGNLLDTFSLRSPQKPYYPYWLGKNLSNQYTFIHIDSMPASNGNIIQVTSMDALFHAPCVSDTAAIVLKQNFSVSVLDSFPLFTNSSTTIPVQDTLLFTPQYFNNIASCTPTLIMNADNPVNNLTVYPDPAHDYIQIKLNYPGNELILLQLINPLGEIIYNEKIKNKGVINSKKISLQKFAAGIYIVRIQTDKKFFLRKFMVE